VVVARGTSSSDRRLIAYVVADSRRAPELLSPGELREFMQDRVPDYMVPSTFVLLEKLPLNSNGKVDRRALPEPGGDRPDLGPAFVAPATPLEKSLAEIWSELLQLQGIGVHDNFFDLGGHSLLATQLVSRIRGRFGVDFPLRDVFRAPTIAELADAIQLASRKPSAPPIERRARPPELPLSFAQQRLWFVEQLSPGTTQYVLPGAARLEGVLHVDALRRSFEEVIRRHEALRTTFQVTESGPVQRIEAEPVIRQPLIDLKALSPPAAESEVERIVGGEGGRPFDLTRGPLIRDWLIQVSERDHVVSFAMHHIASDGWSAGILLHEVAALYEAFSRDAPSPLPDLPVQYADFALWQRDWLAGEVLDGLLSYWREQLADLPELRLPTDRQRPAIQRFRGSAVSFTTATEVSRALEELARSEGATPFMILLGAFSVLLSLHSGQEDIAVATSIAGRNQAATEPLIGFFVNTLVLRADLSGDPSFRELVRRVRGTCLEAYAHQDLPFEKLVEELEVERDLGRSPLAQVGFVLQNLPTVAQKLPSGLTVRRLPTHTGRVNADLVLLMGQSPDGLSGTLAYDSDLFDRRTVLRMSEQFQTLLAGIVDSPDGRLSELSVISEAERERLYALETSLDDLDEMSL
jgi:acyl carrier protein